MRVTSKTESADHVFSAISKEEAEPISAFLKSKNVRLQNEMDETMDIDPISEDDEDMDDASIASEDDPKSKKDKKDKGKTKKPSANDDEDESGTSRASFHLLP